MRNDPEKASLLAHFWADRRYAAMLGLGFSSGIPFLLVYVTQSAWLSEAKVPIETIGLMSELTIAYKFKFFWAPFLEKYDAPIFSGLLGRRRGWIVVSQIAVMLALAMARLHGGLLARPWPRRRDAGRDDRRLAHHGRSRPQAGKSLDMLWLAGQGLKVGGVELSPLACESFFAENNLTPRRCREGAFEVWSADEIRILQGDFFDLGIEQLADCAGVYDRASLVALPPEMRERYVLHLTAILPAAAEMLLLTMEFDQAQRPGPPFAVSEAKVRSLYEPAYEVKHLHTQDSFSPHSHLARQGLTWLEEKVYRIVRR